MASKGSKKAMAVKAEPLGDTSPLARKHTPPQGKGKKVAVQFTKEKKIDIIGTSGHAIMPGRQARNVKTTYARSHDNQQGSVKKLREISKRLAQNPPKLKKDPMPQPDDEPLQPLPEEDQAIVAEEATEFEEVEVYKPYQVPSLRRPKVAQGSGSKAPQGEATGSEAPIHVDDHSDPTSETMEDPNFILRSE